MHSRLFQIPNFRPFCRVSGALPLYSADLMLTEVIDVCCSQFREAASSPSISCAIAAWVLS